MKERQEPFLQFRGQIDQQIAAAHQVQFGEGRVHDDVLGGEGHHLSDLLAHQEVFSCRDKKSVQTFCRDIGNGFGRVEPLAGLVDRILVEIGGKNLRAEIPGRFELFLRFQKDHGQGISFFTSRAAG